MSIALTVDTDLVLKLIRCFRVIVSCEYTFFCGLDPNIDKI